VLTAAVTTSLILGSIALVIFLRSLAALQFKLVVVLSEQRQALEDLRDQVARTEAEEEELSIAKREKDEQEAVLEAGDTYRPAPSEEQQEAAANRVMRAEEGIQASLREEASHVNHCLVAKAAVAAKQLDIKRASGRGKCRIGNIAMTVFSATMTVFFAGVMKRLLASLACSGYFTGSGTEHEFLTADAARLAPRYTSCFVGSHRADVVIGFVGLLGLYPASIVARPMFQVLDPKLKFRFSYNYLFVSGQLQMLLLAVSAFAPKNPDLVLLVALATNVVCVYYFWKHQPCTCHVINAVALRAFGFSASLNVGSMVALHTNNDYGPSLALFVYVGWLVWGLIGTVLHCRGIGFWLVHMRFLRHPNPQQRVAIRLIVRTALVARALDTMSDLAFFADTVYLAEAEEHGMQLWLWSWRGQFVTSICALCVAILRPVPVLALLLFSRVLAC
jgi:hypothetical protein